MIHAYIHTYIHKHRHDLESNKRFYHASDVLLQEIWHDLPSINVSEKGGVSNDGRMQGRWLADWMTDWNDWLIWLTDWLTEILTLTSLPLRPSLRRAEKRSTCPSPSGRPPIYLLFVYQAYILSDIEREHLSYHTYVWITPWKACRGVYSSSRGTTGIACPPLASPPGGTRTRPPENLVQVY